MAINRHNKVIALFYKRPMKTKAFTQIYEALTKENCDSIQEIYHPDIVFEDPIHKTEGLTDLVAYLTDSYKNVHYCRFHITDTMEQDDQACVRWHMLLSHPALAKGKEIKVHGCSALRYQEDLIIYHRDYFDVGEMVYQNLPVLSTVIGMIRQRLKG